jgi:predicted transcriptional regulator
LIRRSIFECSLDILEAVRKPKILTHIMYESNVNCIILKSLLEDLTKKGLISTIEMHRGVPRKHYVLSKKGLDVLCSVRRAAELLQA